MIPKQPRCRYRSPSGRRCRSQASIGGPVCLRHGDHNCAYPAAAEIVANRDRLDKAEGIHAVMARILRGQAAGKILARDATAMMYSCQTMLYSLPRLAEERKKIFVADEVDMWREKALADSHHDKLNTWVESPEVEEKKEK